MTKSGFLCDNQLSEWTEKRLQRTSQCQTCTKNKKGHGHRWSAASLIHYSSLNPGETITSEKYAQQIDEMHRKLQRLQPALVNRKAPFSTMPNCTWHNQHLSWTNWATKYCLICHIHLTSLQPTTTSLSISTTFCKQNASTTSRRQKMLSKSSLNPKACIFKLQA